MREIYPNELYHYGILGQKWGVRRFQNPDGTLTRAGARRYGTTLNYERGMTKRQAKKYDQRVNKQIIRERRQLQQNRRAIGDKQLDDLINRYNNEKKLKDLTNENINPGRTEVAKILGSAGSKVATSALTGGLAYLTYYAINKAGDKTYKIDYSKLAEYVAPNPNKKK